MTRRSFYRSIAYLAGPIDDIATDQARGWRVSLARVLNKLGYVAFDPSAPYLVSQPDLEAHASDIDRANRAIIQLSSVVFANLAGPGRGLGTIREIEFARSLGLPVMVFLPQGTQTTVALHDLHVFLVAADPAQAQAETWSNYAKLLAITDRFLTTVAAAQEDRSK